jgi:hypothetical protein
VLLRPEAAAEVDGKIIDRDRITYLPPTTDRNTIFCAGLNYEAHAAESDIAIPERPLIFMKLPRTLIGHEAPIAYHTRVTEEIDYEAELAAVIGEPARHVSTEDVPITSPATRSSTILRHAISSSRSRWATTKSSIGSPARPCRQPRRWVRT